jgi:gliding motility-associated protein GldM
MSHGNLSPRQKMINMMYLILTALLAMNVSAEVLNAFVLVNDSLIETEKGITGKNTGVYGDFDGMYEANKEKVKPFRDAAIDVGSKSDELVAYITELQKMIITTSREDYDQYLKSGTSIIENKKDKEIPQFVMLEDKSEGDSRAIKLKSMINEYRAKIEAILNKHLKKEDAKILIDRMSINLSTDDMTGQGGDMKAWERANFESLPLVAALTMLTKLKTDILNAQSEAINKLYTQVDAESYKFTNLNAIVKADRGYVLSGETYRAEIFVGAQDTTQNPVIILDNGTPIDSFTSDGKGIYQVKTGGYGINTLKGKILVQRPGSSIIDSFPFETEYQVAAPSVSVSPTKMNVFYIGVDNPVDITAAGTPADQIGVSISGGGGSITRTGSGSYNVKVRSATNNCVVTVSANGRGLGSKTFRVKSVPNPTATIGARGTAYYNGGRIPKSTLLALSGINATMENFDFDLKFTITKFTVTAAIGGFDESATSNSRSFTSQQKNIIRQARQNTRVIIEDIRARGPDGTVRKLNDLVFKLR